MKPSHVLVVSPDEDERSSLYALLDQCGYSVGTCGSELDALHYIARRHPDVVLSALPLLDVVDHEFARMLKEVAPQARVVLLADSGEWPLFFDAIESGGDDLVSKPARQSDVLRAVAAVGA